MQATPNKLHQSPRPHLKILSAGSYQAARNVHFPPHQHAQWELVYYRSGTVVCVMGKEKYPGHVGRVWLTPPGVTHAERAITAYSNYFIALDLAETDRWPAFLDDDRHHSLGRVCQQIVIEWGRRPEERERMLQLLSEQLGCLLDRACSEKVLSPAEQAVVRAERWIEEGAARSLTIREVALGVGVSASALRGYFRTIRGCSPREHLQRVRLDKAVCLLRTSNLKLEMVAELCGYDSASHLTRSVKKVFGQTPGQMRAG